MSSYQPNMQENAQEWVIFTENPLFYAAISAQIATSFQHMPFSADEEAINKIPASALFLAIPEDHTEIATMQRWLEESPHPTLFLLCPTAEAPSTHYETIRRPVRLAALKHKLAEFSSTQKTLPLGESGYFDPRASQIHCGQQSQRLTQRETELLHYLCTHPSPASRELILNQVWNYQEGVDSHTLESTIYRLRNKLAELFNDSVQICHNEPGYSLVIKA